MKKEINAAVKFIIKLIKQNSHLNEKDLARFQQCFKLFLAQKFNNHWHPERPWKGQGYRCLRINGTNGKEPTIDKAASECGLNYSNLKLPLELTVWVDPNEVCCRFGEHKGSYCTVASFQKGKENYCDDVDLIEVAKTDSTRENIKEPLKRVNNSPKTALSPGRKVSRREKVFSPSSPSKRNELATLQHNFNSPLTNENKQCDSNKTLTSGKRVFGSTSNLVYQDPNMKTTFEPNSSTAIPSYYNPVENSSCFYKPPSTWISYPLSVSPPQTPFPSTTYYSQNSNNFSPLHFSSQDNLNVSRISPVNLNKMKWNSTHFAEAETYHPKNGWYMQRQLARV